MSKRRIVDNPGRDPGWSNGKYTVKKDMSDAEYIAYCPECGRDTPHAWDDCTVCLEKKRIAKANRRRNKKRRPKKKQ